MQFRKTLLRAGTICLGIALLGAIALLYGCAAKVPATAGTPGRTGTPIEQALAYNASLADANLSVAQAVIQAQKASLISVDDANRVTTAQSLVADGDRQLTGVLQTVALCLKTGTPATCKTPAGQVQAILTQISTAANNLVKGPDLGIKDAGTKDTILKNLNAVLTLAGSITQSLSASGVLQ